MADLWSPRELKSRRFQRGFVSVTRIFLEERMRAVLKSLSLCLVSVIAAVPALGQIVPAAGPWTAEQDHQDMMDQLGIRSLRPGPGSNASDPNHANTDQSQANPYPIWPDLMTMRDGRKVATPDQWWKQRRPEIAENFEREVYG